MKYKTRIAGVLLGVLSLVFFKIHNFNTRDKALVTGPKLLSDEKVLQIFSYSGFSFVPKIACSCKKEKGLTTYQLQDYLTKNQKEKIKGRRSKELMHFKKRYSAIKKNFLIAPANSPLSYPVHGVQVMPLHTVLVLGLSVHGKKRQAYKVMLQASIGILNTLADVSKDTVGGRGTNIMTIYTTHLSLLNHILKYLTYTSTVFNIDTMDVVNIRMGKHKASFPVKIKQPQIPILFDPGEDHKIRSLVTITTKTFLRYNELRELIKSIRKFYPDIKIIVADDNKETEKIQQKNVEQYFMPFAKGWFAGRNLAVSQVTTKYFLWVDDDFIFTEKTKIEKLVRILEQTDLDVVGGSVDGNDNPFKLVYQEGDGDGSCLHRRNGSYHKLEGFSNCVVASGVDNFFLAHTRKVSAVGFDPKLQRMAQTEFFIDGFGRLRVGSCNDVIVGHQSKIDPQTEEEKTYSQYTQETNERLNFRLNLFYFKNNLKCYTQL